MQPDPVIARPRRTTRCDLFRTRSRDHTTNISLNYAGTQPDPRIGVEILDVVHAVKASFSCLFHYVIRTSGLIEIGRHPATVSTRSRELQRLHFGLHIGIVGGIDPETGARMHTITPEQEASVEYLMQRLADYLQEPLEVHDHIADWATLARADADHEAEEREQEEEDALDRLEDLSSGDSERL